MVDVTGQSTAAVRTGDLSRWRLETLGLLAAGVAHDLNNLLTVIANYAAMAAEPREGSRPPDQADWLRILADMEHIRVAAQRGSALTGQLLAHARSTARPPGGAAGRSGSCRVETVVDETLTLVRASVDRRIAVLAEHAGDCPPAALDPGALSQVLVNLLVNARDALPAGGRITVRTGAAPSSPGAGAPAPAAGGGPQALIEVSDTGDGIPAELLGRVFEPFVSTKAAGSGLGLAMVQEIVAAAGGCVRLASTAGAGTTVTVLLPAA